MAWIVQRIGAARSRTLVQAALSDPGSAWRALDLAAARVEAEGAAMRCSPRRDYADLLQRMEELLANGSAKHPTAAARALMKGAPVFSHKTLMRRWRAAMRAQPGPSNDE
jgi:hypothetical protein